MIKLKTPPRQGEFLLYYLGNPNNMFGFKAVELQIFKKLRSPQQIQDFLDTIPIVGKGGDRCRSPRCVLAEKRAHCMEGAMLAAVALRFNGYKPLVVDLKSTRDDFDHVIAVFKQRGHWGALSKTNYAVLRYREPIYRTIRELVMSFFHEYFTDDGKKTLRSYSVPVDLSIFDRKGWMTSEKDIWYIPRYLDKMPHKSILTRSMIASLRPTHPIEIKIGKVRQWHKKK